MAGFAGLIKEARRRRVFRVIGLYIVASWVAVQVASEIFPALNLDAAAIRYVWLSALLGFPLALIFGWLYDVTPAGLRRTPPPAGDEVDLSLRRTDYLVLVALALVAVGIISQVAWQMEPQHRIAGSPEAMSIAVLPLQNLSGDPEQAFFVAGMQDMLISALSRISGFRVTSRTSTLAFANSRLPASAIAEQLGVSKIVEGSVYKVDDAIRVIVQLIDAKNDEHLWEASYERELSDVLRLQSQITRAIAEEIQVTLTQAESRDLARAGLVNPEAYKAYLKGNFHADKFTPADLQQAVQFYQRAVQLDPDNALPYWGLTRICRWQLQMGLVRPREGEPRCREHLMRALELDDLLAEVHLGLALSYWLYDYNWPAAQKSFLRALELNPSYAEARMFFSHFLGQVGRPEESTLQILKARDLDPLNVFMKGLHGAQLAVIEDYESAIALIEECLAESPSLGFGYDVLWSSNALLGREAESVDAAVAHFAVTMGKRKIAAAIEEGFESGDFESAMRAGAVAAERLNQESYVPAVEIAQLWGLGGNPDKAYEWLDRAYEQHDPTLPYINSPVYLGEAEDDLRFSEMLQRMNLDAPIGDGF